MLERGFKFRKRPLPVMATNSGTDRKTVCWEEHEAAVKAIRKRKEDEAAKRKRQKEEEQKQATWWAYGTGAAIGLALVVWVARRSPRGKV